ncbi:MAG: hypothetical protein ACLRZ6_06105 [Lachnospiraceae bacterium]
MPDIDVDFCFERRQEVIDYVVKSMAKIRSFRLLHLVRLLQKLYPRCWTCT